MIYITSKWINFSFITPANPLCPGRIVIWYWAWSSHTGNKLGSCLWKTFSLKLSTPLILKFCLLEVGATVFVDLWADAGTVVRVLVSLLTYLTESDTRFEIAKWVPQVAFFLPCPVLLYLKLCWSLRKVEMHKGICFPKDTALHLYPNCMGPVYEENILEADMTTEMQTGLSLESLLFGKFDEIFGEEVSTLNCPWGSLTANLSPGLGNLADIRL